MGKLVGTLVGLLVGALVGLDVGVGLIPVGCPDIVVGLDVTFAERVGTVVGRTVEEVGTVTIGEEPGFSVLAVT